MFTAFLLINVLFLSTGALGLSTELQLGEESEVHETNCNHYGYFAVDVPNPCDDLYIKVKNISGEPNLYVSREPYENPTYRSLAWSSYEWGGEELKISSWNVNFKAGRYFIGVHAYCGDDVSTGHQSAKYTVLVKQIPHEHPRTKDLFGVSESGMVANNSYVHHRFCLPSECYKVEVSLTNCLDPKVCPTTYSYPELIVSPTEEKPDQKSMAWILAEVEHRSIVLNPSEPNVDPGHYYITVYGWCTPDDICVDKSLCGPCSYAQETHYNISVIPTNLCIGASARPIVSPILAVLLLLIWFGKIQIMLA